MDSSITLRDIRSDDRGLLYRVYASTRVEELAPLDWNEAEKETFLNMQFNAQHQYYHDQFPDSDFQIILLKDSSIGRLYVHRRDDEIRIIDIAILPEHRNAGIGTAILKDLMDEATKRRKPIRIHVEKFNPALRLYERLGFSKIEDQGVYYLLEWSPCTT